MNFYGVATQIETYSIDLFRLSNSVHDYQFDFDDSFFELFDQTLIQKGAGSVSLELEKTDRLLRLNFNIQGSIGLTCDRSLEEFDESINLDYKLLIKYGELSEELSEDIIVIPRESQSINVAQYMYEYIALSVPMKCLHPKFRDEEEEYDFDDEPKMVYSSEQSTEANEEDSNVEDPRWNKLKEIRKNN